MTANSTGRLRAFATAQIAASFLLMTGAAALVQTLLTLQSTDTGLDIRRVLAIPLPVNSYGKTPGQISGFYEEAIRRVRQLPGVDGAALGVFMPWKDSGKFGPGFQFTAEGYVRGSGEEDPRGRYRVISPGFFAALGVPIVAGRDFNELDRKENEQVAIVSRAVAQRMFPNREVVNRHILFTDPLLQFAELKPTQMRIVGVASDIDDENVVPRPAMTIYTPLDQGLLFNAQLFVHARADPYSLASPITRAIRDLSVEQPIERAATLEDVRAEVLTPDRLNAIVFGGFALVALTIAVVGVAGVLAFSVSGRTREFGIRLALGSQRSHVIGQVIKEGAVMAAIGIVAGMIGGFALQRLAGAYFDSVRAPGVWAVAGTAVVLLAAAVIAAAAPAVRAARVDVINALRSD